MKICVSGWYFDLDLFKVFGKIEEEVTVLIYYRRANGEIARPYDTIPVEQQIKNARDASGADIFKIPIAGLEWGGYDWYLKNYWDKQSNVLFMHDDVKILDSTVFKRIEEMENIGIDQAYIFRDEAEEVANGRMHGRGVYCSQRFLEYARNYVCLCGQAFDHIHPHYPNEEPPIILSGTGPHTGFWYDPYNLGEHTNGAVPRHCRHYNTGIYHFAAFAGRCARSDHEWPGLKTAIRAHFWDFNSGKRGEWKGKIYGRG